MKNQKKLTIREKICYIDKNIFDIFEHFKKALKVEWDLVFLVDGVEGVGKTKTVAFFAWILNNFIISLANFVWTTEQFMNAVDNAPYDGLIIWDEAVLGLFSSERGKMALALAKKFATIRSKRLKIIIISPCYFELKHYISVRRTKFLIHLTTPDFYQRGFFDYYSYKRKNLMYRKNKYTGLYEGCKPNFSGNIIYNKTIVDNLLDWEQYENLKQEAIKSMNEDKKGTIQQRDKLIINYIDKCVTFGQLKKDIIQEIAKTLEMNHTSINNIYYNKKEEIEG